MKRRPEFALVGAPKTGTTALYTWLREHPEIYLPAAKELHYFDLHHDRGSEWYLRQFEEAGDRLAGEATTTYLAHPTAIEELSSLNPDIRIIATVRNPVDRAWSHYNYGVARSWFSKPFEAMMIEDFAALLEGRQAPHGLVDGSRYGHNLERANQHISLDHILVLRIEDIAAEPIPTFERVCRFLGVGDHVRPANLGSEENATRHVRYPRLFRTLLRTRLDRALPEPARARLGQFLSAPGYPDLSPDLRASLDAAFAEDQARLQRFVLP